MACSFASIIASNDVHFCIFVKHYRFNPQKVVRHAARLHTQDLTGNTNRIQSPVAFNRRIFVFITSAYAQSAPAAAPASDLSSSLMSMLPLVLMFVVLYFVMIRPQMKRQKELKAMLDALAKGDEVVTNGGMLGKIAQLGDNQIGLEVGNGVVLQLQRSAVVQVLPKGSIK
jgi:preprotein translocase subunit YajC